MADRQRKRFQDGRSLPHASNTEDPRIRAWGKRARRWVEIKQLRYGRAVPETMWNRWELFCIESVSWLVASGDERVKKCCRNILGSANISGNQVSCIHIATRRVKPFPFIDHMTFSHTLSSVELSWHQSLEQMLFILRSNVQKYRLWGYYVLDDNTIVKDVSSGYCWSVLEYDQASEGYYQAR